MLPRIKSFFIAKTMWIFLLVVACVALWIMQDKMKKPSWIYTVYMDGGGYYGQLPAFFIYDDPTYSFYSTEAAIAGDAPVFLREIDGKPVNKYFSGEPFLQLPFFAAGHLIAKTTGEKPNGYSKPYYYCIAIATLFYFLLGFFFLWKLLEKFLFRKRVILLVCFCFAFGTNLFHYAVYEPAMSHVYSFAAVTGFLFFMRCFFLSPLRKYLLLSAAALGIVALLRPVNLVMFLAFPLMAGEWQNVKNGFAWLRKNGFAIAIALIIFLAICFVQLYMYHWQTGKFFIWAYRDEGFDFIHTHFWGTLFGFEKGLFIYTPMILFALFGLFIIARRSRYLFISFLPVLFFIAWIVSAWHEWKYGYSFGLRAYIDYYALAAIAMAFLVDFACRRKVIFAPVVAVALLLVAVYGIQQYQYLYRIIHPGAMDKEMYQLVFLKTDKKYQDTVTFLLQAKESDGGFNDMEGTEKWPGSETITNEIYFSGKHSSRIDSSSIYSSAFTRNMSDSFIYVHPVRLVISARVLRNSAADNALLAVAQVKDDRTFFMEYYPLPSIEKNGAWQLVQQEVKIPQAYADNELLKVFFLHKSGVLFIDDFRVEVKGR